MIKLENNKIQISEDTILYLQKSFTNFDISKFDFLVSNNESKRFQIFYSYSYDKINYSEYLQKTDFENPTENLDFFVAIYIKQIVSTDLQKPLTLYQTENVDKTDYYIEIESLKYNDIEINLLLESECKFELFDKLVNQFPKWNFYDNKKVSIDRWLAQCNAIAEMYGHTCIYFKTEPVEAETVHTFKTHVFRNVVNIKKLHILAPNNELPQDRNIYSEWDMPLQDDFVIHIVKEKFEQAFGKDLIPVEKDYLYLPIINKLFRVATSQPKNGFMGKIGWWEVYLAKFEEDDCVSIDEDLKATMEGFEAFDDAISNIDMFDDSVKTEIFSQLKTIKEDIIETNDKIQEKTIDEKNKATQNYTNKLVDSTTYISLKETEKLREFFNSRLEIISVNPDSSSFPITMYDNTKVDKRTIAMQYNLNDYTIKNKLTLNADKSFQLSFNYVLLNNFSGEIFDLLASNGNLSLFTIRNTRNKLEIFDNNTQKSFLTNFILSLKEIYNIVINYDTNLKQFSIMIFSLLNQEKKIEYQNIYIIETENKIIPLFSHIHLYGGNFYSNDITFSINEKQILKDYVNPILIK